MKVFFDKLRNTILYYKELRKARKLAKKNGVKIPRNRLKIRIFFINLSRAIIIAFLLFSGLSSFYKVLSIVAVLYFYHLFTHKAFWKKNDVIVMFFGTPGSGKTTLAAYLSHLAQLRGDKVASNCDIKGNYILDPVNDLGQYSMFNNGLGTVTILDEASLDYDCRGFASLSEKNKRFFALHRHEACPVYCFSQAIDIDKKIRDRASCCYYVQRGLIPHTLIYRKIKKTIVIDDNHQLLDGFDFVKFSKHILFCGKYWKMFDTLDRTMCPTKEKHWKLWGQKVEAPSDASKTVSNELSDDAPNVSITL